MKKKKKKERENFERFYEMKCFKMFLTLFSIYTHFNTLKKKDFEKHCGKNEQFHLSYNVFYVICIRKSFDSHISVVIWTFFEFEFELCSIVPLVLYRSVLRFCCCCCFLFFLMHFQMSSAICFNLDQSKILFLCL